CSPSQDRYAARRLKLLANLCQRFDRPAAGKRSSRPTPLTFGRTARRSFEVAYWQTIATLAHGDFINKENADCVHDSVTQALGRCHHRQLEQLGDYLIDHYRRVIARQRMTGKALVGELPFQWQTDFEFPLYGGWLDNQRGRTHD